jgi:hypothetical protein
VEKNLANTLNTLAYSATPSVAKKNSLIRLTRGLFDEEKRTFLSLKMRHKSVNFASEAASGQ